MIDNWRKPITTVESGKRDGGGLDGKAKPLTPHPCAADWLDDKFFQTVHWTDIPWYGRILVRWFGERRHSIDGYSLWFYHNMYFLLREAR